MTPAQRPRRTMAPRPSAVVSGLLRPERDDDDNDAPPSPPPAVRAVPEMAPELAPQPEPASRTEPAPPPPSAAPAQPAERPAEPRPTRARRTPARSAPADEPTEDVERLPLTETLARKEVWLYPSQYLALTQARMRLMMGRRRRRGSTADAEPADRRITENTVMRALLTWAIEEGHLDELSGGNEDELVDSLRKRVKSRRS